MKLCRSIIAGIALLGASHMAQANETNLPKQFEYKLEVSKHGEIINTSSVYSYVGQAVPFEMSAARNSSTCIIKDTDLTSTVTQDNFNGIAYLLISSEVTETGIKSYISISKQSADVGESQKLMPDCDLYDVSSETVNRSGIYDLQWNKPKTITFKDGTTIKVSVSKPEPKLTKA